MLHTNVKDKDKPEDRQEAVLKIKCCGCKATYIGETRRNHSTRLTERKRVTRNGDVNNHFADHHLQTKHQSDWDSATCIMHLSMGGGGGSAGKGWGFDKFKIF